MKIGLIIHSNTGHTLEVANDLKMKLAHNHEVTLLHVNSKNEEQSQKGFVELKDSPDINGFDYLVFGAPIHGFALSKTMATYLKQLQNKSHKNAFIFVTHFFPSPGLGGRQGLRQMIKYLTSKDIQIVNASIIPWTFGKRKAIKHLLSAFDIIEN